MTTASAIASAILIYLTVSIRSVEFALLLIVAVVGTLIGARHMYITASHVNIVEQTNPVVAQKPADDEDPQPPV